MQALLLPELGEGGTHGRGGSAPTSGTCPRGRCRHVQELGMCCLKGKVGEACAMPATHTKPHLQVSVQTTPAVWSQASEPGPNTPDAVLVNAKLPQISTDGGKPLCKRSKHFTQSQRKQSLPELGGEKGSPW